MKSTAQFESVRVSPTKPSALSSPRAVVVHSGMVPRVRRFLVMGGLGWTLLLFILMGLNIRQTQHLTDKLVLHQARTSLNEKQIIYQRAAALGGVYVPLDDQQAPESALDHIRDRDMALASGELLTPVNPAHIIEFTGVKSAQANAVTGYLIGVSPLSNNHLPDDWQRAAMESFEQGRTEAYIFSRVGEHPVLRMMQPLVNRETCRPCHNTQEFRLGDIQGGIEIVVPMDATLAEEREHILLTVGVFVALWSLCMAGLVVIGRRLMRHVREREDFANRVQTSQVELAAIYERMPLLLMVVDRDRRVEKINHAAAAFAGRSIEQLLGLRGGAALSCIHANDSPNGCGYGPACGSCTVSKVVLETFKTGQHRQQVEAQIEVDHLPEPLTCLISTEMLDLPQGQRVLVCLEDITQRRKAEEALKTSQRMLINAERIAHLGSYVYTVRTDEMIWSDELRAILDIDSDTTPSLAAARALIHPDDAARVATETEPVFREGGEFSVEYRIVRSNGAERYVLEQARSRAGHAETRPEIIYGSLQDITTHKQNENAIRRAELRYRVVADFTYDWEYWADPDGTLRYVSPACARITGYSADEFMDAPGLIEWIILPEDIPIWRAHQRAAATRSEHHALQFRIRRKDGAIRWVEHVCRLVYDDHVYMGTRSSNRDITERKLAEKELRENRNTLMLAQEIANVGYWTWDIADGEVFWSEQFYRILGFNADEVTPSLEAFRQTIFSDDIDLEKDALQVALDAPGQVYDVQHRIVRPDGTMRVVRSQGRVTNWSFDGLPLFMIGTTHDITSQVQAQIAEREQRALAEALRDTMAALSQTLNLDEVFDRILANLSTVVPYDAANLMLEQDGHWQVAHSVGYAERGLDGWLRQQQIPGGVPRITMPTIADRQPVIVADTRSDADWLPTHEDTWIRSHISCPICYAERVMGFINLSSSVPFFFNEDHAERLRAFADQAAVALRNAELFEAERRERILAETYQTMAESLSVSPKLDDSLKMVIDLLGNVVQYDYAAVMIVEGNQLRVMAANSSHSAGSDHEAHQLGRLQSYTSIELYYTALATGEAQVIHDTETDPNWHDMPHPETSARAWIGMPITVWDVTLGLLSISSRNAGKYTARDVNAVSAFARRVAQAIETSQLYTQLETSQADLQKARAHLTQTARLSVAGEIAAGVAHQINNPLTTVVAHAHLLLRRLPPDSPNYRSVEAIRRATYRAGTVVQRLLDFARPNTFVIETLDVNQSITYAISLVRAQIEPHVARIELVLAPDLPEIKGSRQHLEDVWINLVLNAKDAVQLVENGAIRVQTAYVAELASIQVRVEDNGVGIPAANLERVFDPLFTTKQRGTGLGLSVCHDVVARHGGLIDVTSEEHLGTTFMIMLPVRNHHRNG